MQYNAFGKTGIFVANLCPGTVTFLSFRSR